MNAFRSSDQQVALPGFFFLAPKKHALWHSNASSFFSVLHSRLSTSFFSTLPSHSSLLPVFFPHSTLACLCTHLSLSLSPPFLLSILHSHSSLTHLHSPRAPSVPHISHISHISHPPPSPLIRSISHIHLCTLCKDTNTVITRDFSHIKRGTRNYTYVCYLPLALLFFFALSADREWGYQACSRNSRRAK